VGIKLGGEPERFEREQDILAVAAGLGIDLMPWQIDVIERMLEAGDFLVKQRNSPGRQAAAVVARRIYLRKGRNQ